MKRMQVPALWVLLLFIIFSVSVYFAIPWIRWVDNFGETFLRPNTIPKNVHIFESITRLGSAPYLGVFILMVIAVLWFCQKKRAILPYLVANLFSAVLVELILKPFIHRLRPSYGLIIQSGYSFPSGHAAAVTVAYGLAFGLSCYYLKETWHRLIIGILFGSLILLVMWSRVYLGVHYLSDVLGGFILGTAQILFILRWNRW